MTITLSELNKPDNYGINLILFRGMEGDVRKAQQSQ